MRILGLFAISVAGAAGMSGSAAPPVNDGPMLDALDPTRIARSVCGARTGFAAFDARMMLAAGLAGASDQGSAAMPLLPGIGRTDIPLDGMDDAARRYFDQGVAFAYGFNHEAATRSFREARRLAPSCALCWWGEALANGPNINAGMDAAQNRSALAALEQARALATGASALERDLIEAQSLRYAPAPDADRAGLDAAYADAMLALADRYPASDDIAVLAAEAAMNTTAWDYWDADGNPNTRVAEAVALVERVIARNPRHPQAPHLYIHLMENSPDPQKAEAAADGLKDAAPPALGHLVHMPAHIYYRIGRYQDSIDANIAAARADEEYLAAIGDSGLYRYGYYPHNVHFLLASAQMTGRMNLVTNETERLKRILDLDTARQTPWVQAIHAAPSFALAQYASPQAVLALTDTASELAYVEAMRRYARALAHAGQGDGAAFAADLAAMESLAASPDAEAMVEAGFPAPDIIRLAALVARGKQAHLAGDFAAAIRHFEQAEDIERTIPYTEPPYWYYPVAQSRGAALHAAGRYRDARDAFMKALVDAPNNGWALYGLEMTHRRLGNAAEARAARAAFDRVWRGDRAWLRMDRL